MPPSPAVVEAELAAAWERDRVYAWDATRPRSETFVVDTPPPTVSGSLHVGHVFSFTQTDVIVRYQRMRGRNIYYPMGWDDNGLPTKRRVLQRFFHVRVDPSAPPAEIAEPTPEDLRQTRHVILGDRDDAGVLAGRVSQPLLKACGKERDGRPFVGLDLWNVVLAGRPPRQLGDAERAAPVPTE